MKKIKIALVVTFYLLLSTFSLSAQNVGINTTGATPDASALLDLNSTNRGFLITRVDTANIPSPAFGLMTLSPTDSCLYLYNGIKWMSIGGVGRNCSNSGSSTPVTPVFPCGGTVIPVIDVTNPITKKTWMDRNLGASQVATKSKDVDAYGDLYQWGRCSDGHEKRNSGMTATLSTSDTPVNGDFITTSKNPHDWRTPKNDSLWQRTAGINNPCPTGYRIPTEAELDAERLSWATNNPAGAFGSPLKLTLGGNRHGDDGFSYFADKKGYYWSSTVSGNNARYLNLTNGNAKMATVNRAYAFSVRCIKN